MRAVQVVEYGKPVQIRNIAIPEPALDEVRIKVLAAGVNFADLLQIKGLYQEKHPLPFTLGMEVCGIIDSVSDQLYPSLVGQRVSAFLTHGCMAEYCCLPYNQCIHVPATMTSANAAGFLITYCTSLLALKHRAKLLQGERLLVLGAGSGVGLTAVEIGKILGAEVVAAARGRSKLDAAKKAGADHLLDIESVDIPKAVKELGGADIVYDPVGGDLFKQALRVANPEARLIPIGFASGTIPQIPANILLIKNISVLGVYLGGYSKFNSQVISNGIETLMNWFNQGRLRPLESKEIDLNFVADALKLLEERKAVGKVVIRISHQ